MKLQLRPAAAADIPAISELIDAAYAPQVRRLFGDSPRGHWGHYDEGRVSGYLQREQEGVRVGITQNRLVSVCVCRSYGAIGWFHSLAVHPEMQHRGFGRQVVSDAQSYLSARGVQTMALMTWPDAVNNIGFYQHLGYRPVGLSLYAYRLTPTALATGRPPLRSTLLSRLNDQACRQAIDAAKTLGDSLMPGLDYRPWIHWTLNRGSGDVLVIWREQQPVALALAYHSGAKMDWLEGKLMMISPESTPHEVAWILELVRRWAVELHCTSFGFPVDITHSATAEWCQRFGFRLFGDSMLNLLRGGPWPPDGIHLVRFSG